MFMSAARPAARLKPVIAIKAGRQPAAAKAATSHTGALAGLDAVYDAAFRRAGILRVYDVDEVFDAVETLSYRIPVEGARLTILTNGGGLGVLATDALSTQGGNLAVLSADTAGRLSGVLPPTWSHGNPVDIIGDADANRYEQALRTLTGASDQDAVLVLNCPTAVGDSDAAATTVAAVARHAITPVQANWLAARSAEQARAIFSDAGIPAYDTPEKAVRGFMHMVRYKQSQDVLVEVPPASPEQIKSDRAHAKAVVADQANGWMSSEQVQDLLACYGIPFPQSIRVATPEEAARVVLLFGGSVVFLFVLLVFFFFSVF